MRYKIFLLSFLFFLQVFLVNSENNLLQEGISLFEKGLYQEALNKFKKVYQDDKNNIIALKWIAYTYYTLGMWSEALKEYRTLQKLEDDIEIQKSIALILVFKKDYYSAIKEYLKILKKTPSDEQANFYLAYSYLFVGDYFQAEKYFKNLNSQIYKLKANIFLEMIKQSKTPNWQIQYITSKEDTYFSDFERNYKNLEFNYYLKNKLLRFNISESEILEENITKEKINSLSFSSQIYIKKFPYYFLLGTTHFNPQNKYPSPLNLYRCPSSFNYYIGSGWEGKNIKLNLNFSKNNLLEGIRRLQALKDNIDVKTTSLKLSYQVFENTQLINEFLFSYYKDDNWRNYYALSLENIFPHNFSLKVKYSFDNFKNPSYFYYTTDGTEIISLHPKLVIKNKNLNIQGELGLYKILNTGKELQKYSSSIDYKINKNSHLKLEAIRQETEGYKYNSCNLGYLLQL